MLWRELSIGISAMNLFGKYNFSQFHNPQNYVPTGIRTRVEGLLRQEIAPQASGMSTTPSGQTIPHGMLQVIKLVGLTLWSARSG